MNRIVGTLALTFAISPVAAQKAHVDFDHSCDFSHYQTYRWAGPHRRTILNQLMQERVIGFIEEALSAKRLKRVETGGDLLISSRRMSAQGRGIHDFLRLMALAGADWAGVAR